jgi:hypothetical protein
VLTSLGTRPWQLHLLKEALEATTAAREVYLNAGMTQYKAYFAGRIEALEAGIAALEKR